MEKEKKKKGKKPFQFLHLMHCLKDINADYFLCLVVKLQVFLKGMCKSATLGNWCSVVLWWMLPFSMD